MKTIVNVVLVTSLLIAGVNINASSAATDKSVKETGLHKEEIAAKAGKTLERSAMALENAMKDSANCIPSSLVNIAEGVVIFPNAFKLAIGAAGGQMGRGIAMIRLDDGSWSNPCFVTLGEGSIGLQIGAQRSDIILLFRNRDDILNIDDSGIVIGSGMAVAAGPDSKEMSAATDINFESEIYSYHFSKGLFAGISLNGGILSNSNVYNDSFYWMENAVATDIFHEVETPYNDEVNDLIQALNMYGE